MAEATVQPPTQRPARILQEMLVECTLEVRGSCGERWLLVSRVLLPSVHTFAGGTESFRSEFVTSGVSFEE